MIDQEEKTSKRKSMFCQHPNLFLLDLAFMEMTEFHHATRLCHLTDNPSSELFEYMFWPPNQLMRV